MRIVLDIDEREIKEELQMLADEAQRGSYDWYDTALRIDTHIVANLIKYIDMIKKHEHVDYIRENTTIKDYVAYADNMTELYRM